MKEEKLMDWKIHKFKLNTYFSNFYVRLNFCIGYLSLYGTHTNYDKQLI